MFMLFQLNMAFAYSGSVVIVYDQNNKTYTFAALEMKKGIESAGYTVTLANIENLSTITAEHRIILTTRGTSEANKYLNQSGVSPLPTSIREGYSIRKNMHGNFTDWYIVGFDKSGTMYGGLDFSQSLKFGGFNGIKESDKKPYIKNRGIKFNIPLDARTPSYSDNSDVAQSNIVNMWDIKFWHKFLDDMAKDHLNMISLWSLAPFPSLVNVPEYPNASLNDVKKTTVPPNDFKSLTGTTMSNPNIIANLVTLRTITIADKVKFWQEVMQYASDRGIDCYIFTWNIFVYGTEESGYGFTTSVTDLKTRDYFRKATKALIISYPLLKGIGITAGENMSWGKDVVTDEHFLYDSYGQGINDALALEPNRTFRLIHRTIQSNVNEMKAAFSGLNSRCPLEFSYKYSQAHVYTSVKPQYIKKDNFLNNIGNSRYFFTIRDDDWYYLRGGSDPAFTREYIKNMPTENFDGFYMGPDGYTWGREYISKNPNFSDQLVYDKRWYCFHIWGELAYDPNIPDLYFVNVLKVRFPKVNAQNLYNAWAKASQVVPLVNRFHNIGCVMDYQWYPEACAGSAGFHTVDKFISTGTQNGEGLMNITEYADAVLNKTAITGTTPIQVARNLQEICDEALSLTKGMSDTDPELLQIIEDIKAMSCLGQYYSKKILGATNKCLSDKSSDAPDPTMNLQYKKEAIKDLQDASKCWRDYAGIVSKSYKPQYLTRMQRIIDVKTIQDDVDNEIVLLGGSISPIPATTSGGGKIAYDVSSSSKTLFKNNVTWSHMTGSGSNKMLVVGIAIEDPIASNMEISSVTYNGSTMNLVTNSNVLISASKYSKSILYYMTNPPTGPHNISVTTTGICKGIIVGAISLFGVYQGMPEAVKTNSNINITSISTDITTQTDGAWVVDLINDAGDSIKLYEGTGMTKRWNTLCSSLTAAASAQIVAKAGLTTISWSADADKPHRMAHSLAVFKPALEEANTTSNLTQTIIKPPTTLAKKKKSNQGITNLSK